MKRLLLLLMICIAGSCATAQTKPDIDPVTGKVIPPYKKSRDLPEFKIRLLDSVTVFNTRDIPKGKPTLLVLFDPDCKHCQALMPTLLNKMDSLKNIQFYFITMSNYKLPMDKFYAEFKLGSYPNIKRVGRDYQMFFLDYYGVRHFPSFVMYDKKKKFVHYFEGNVTVKELYDYSHKN